MKGSEWKKQSDMDRAGFERFYRENFHRIYKRAYKAVGNRHRAEEMTQDIFLSLYEEYGKLNSLDDAMKWMNRVTGNKIKNTLRDSKVFVRLIETVSVNKRGHPSPETSLSVREVLERLPRKQALTVLLRLRGHTFEEIGRIMGIKKASAYDYYLKASEEIKNSLQ